ncbi:MAG TPA: helix-turn-helix domain-containing protein [Pyrinomonadaceae bacterium]
MNAIISGRSGRALLIDGDSLKSFEVDDPSTLTSRQQEDLPYLFGEGSDLRILEDTSIEDVELELRNHCNFTWALDLTLISLDADVPIDIRTESIESLEELLETEETLIQVENVLYAQPLPEDADLKGALELCNPSARNTVHTFLLDLDEFQPRISVVFHAWESIPTKLFGDYEARDAFRAVAINEGYFKMLAIEPRSSLFHLQLMLNPSLSELPNSLSILRKWHDLSDERIDLKHFKPVDLGMSRSGSYGMYGRVINPVFITKALRKTHGNQARAARLLGISPSDLRKLLSQIKDKKPKARGERPKLDA